MANAKKGGFKFNINPRVKENLKLGASSLISNASCVELGRHKPWYAAIIAGLLSIILALTPIMVSNFSVKGGTDFFGTYTYGYEEGLVYFQEDMADLGVKLYVDTKEQTLTATNWDKVTEKKAETGYSYDITWYRHINNITDPQNPFVDFEAYYIPYEEDSAFTTAVNNIINCKTWDGAISRNGEYASLSTTSSSSSSSSSGSSTIAYQTNVLILGKTKFTAYKYSTASTTKSGGYVYLYDNGQSFDIVEKFKKGASESTTTYMDKLKTNWINFMNDAYNSNMIKAGWANTGIMAGVFAGFVLLMGLLVFLMTRGKNNPFKIYTWWECQKIAYWAAFTPGLLALGLGFIPMFSSYAMFIFIFLDGMRIMWLSMKTLRPDASQEPSNKK